MKSKYGTITFLVLLALLFLPTGSVYAQGPGPGNGQVIFGSNITIESGDTFEGDLVLFGGNVTIEINAVLDGDLVIIGGRLESRGELDGDVVVVGGQADLEDAAVVSGDVVLVGGQLQKADGAKIDGEVINNVAPKIDIANGRVPPDAPEMPFVELPSVVNVEFNPYTEFMRVFGSSILMAVLGMLAVLFFQKRLDYVSQAVISQPLMVGAMGLLSVVVGFMLFLTVVPIIALAFAWLFGVIAIGQEVGERLAKAMRQQWTTVINTGLGTFLLMFVVGSIQSVNDLVWLVGCFTWIIPVFIGLLAIGGVVVTRFGAKPVQNPALSVFTPPSGPGEEIPPAS